MAMMISARARAYINISLRRTAVEFRCIGIARPEARACTRGTQRYPVTLSEIEIFMYYTHSLFQPHFCDLLPGKRKGGRCNGDFRIMVNTQLTHMHMHAAQIATYVASTAYLSRITHQSKEGGGGGGGV